MQKVLNIDESLSRRRMICSSPTSSPPPLPSASCLSLSVFLCVAGSVSDPYPDPDWIRILSGQLIRIFIRNPDPDPYQWEQKWLTKIEKSYEMSCFGSLLRAEGFSRSLDVLYGVLGISKLQFLIFKKSNLFPRCKYFSILVIKTLDPVRYSA
jgi:hypothetical protein